MEEVINIIKKLFGKNKIDFHLNRFFLKYIDDTITRITNGSYRSIDTNLQKQEDVIDQLYDYLDDDKNYWIRNVPPLDIISKRDEIVEIILNRLLKECNLKLLRINTSLNQISKRYTIIFNILNEYLEQCNIEV